LAREILVSDIPAGDGKIDNLLYSAKPLTATQIEEKLRERKYMLR
jgi:hypothetical protein